MSLWVPSPNFHRGRRRPLAFIVWHSTESQEKEGAAESVARNWFGKPSSKVSAHVVADNTSVVECVKPENTAWHCANGNAAGYGIEVVGKASQDAAGWTDDYSLAAVRNACAWIRTQPALENIPWRRLTDDQLRRHEAGHTTHLQVSQVLGGTTHTDPGPGFPWDVVIAAALPPVPVPSGFPRLAYGDRSDSVRRLQEFAIHVFPSYATFTPTGFYGDATRGFVREFIRRAAVKTPAVDGSVVDQAVHAALAVHGYKG